MTQRFFSDKNRPVHMGRYPCELLARQDDIDLTVVPPMQQLRFDRPDDPASIVNAMREHQAMLDAIRDGLVNKARSDAPADPQVRADHLRHSVTLQTRRLSAPVCCPTVRYWTHLSATRMSCGSPMISRRGRPRRWRPASI